jgi:glutamate racemase
MKNMIGIFDSGIGGLTVVKQVFKYLPEYEIIYLGDTGRFPYSTKPLENKINFSLQDAEFLIKQDAKILIIACNTITSFAGQKIRKKSSIPVFDVVSSGAYGASKITKNNRVGLIGSRDTINSDIYKLYLKNINPEIKLFPRAAQLFIYLVEENYIDYPETTQIVKNYLEPFKKDNIDTLVLGCTHFPYLKKEIKKAVGKRINLIDPAEELVLQLKEYLNNHTKTENKLARGRNHKFFVSGDVDNFQKSAKKIFSIDLKNVSRLVWDNEN